MNLTFIVIIGMLTLSVLAPFAALYAVSRNKKKDYKSHIKIQNGKNERLYPVNFQLYTVNWAM